MNCTKFDVCQVKNLSTLEFRFWNWLPLGNRLFSVVRIGRGWVSVIRLPMGSRYKTTHVLLARIDFDHLPMLVAVIMLQGHRTEIPGMTGRILGSVTAHIVDCVNVTSTPYLS